MRPRRIELHLDQIRLEGVPPEQRQRVIAALERELARRLQQGERPRGSRDRITADQTRERGPEALGAAVARAITKGGES